jgi:hypothetical protein
VQLHEELSLHAKLNNVEEIEKNWKSAWEEAIFIDFNNLQQQIWSVRVEYSFKNSQSSESQSSGNEWQHLLNKYNFVEMWIGDETGLEFIDWVNWFDWIYWK